MRTVLLVAALTLLGCKDKTAPAPATNSPPPAPAEAGPVESPPPPPPPPPNDAATEDAAAAPPDAYDDTMDKVMASPKCCCALASTEPSYELQPRMFCEQDLHGTCVIARKCNKQK